MNKFILLSILGAMMSSCTLSFQNIDTHGAATDLIDENQSASPDVSPTITVPVSALPEVLA